MHWDAYRHRQYRPNVRPWLEIIVRFIQGSSQPIDIEMPMYNMPREASYFARHRVQQEHQDQQLTVHRENVPAPVANLVQPSHFVCICIRHISRTKYLHHVEADRKPPQSHPDSEVSTDCDMFRAIQRRYYSVRPWWKRLLICARLSSVQYYEVCLYMPDSSCPSCFSL